MSPQDDLYGSYDTDENSSLMKVRLNLEQAAFHLSDVQSKLLYSPIVRVTPRMFANTSAASNHQFDLRNS